MSGRHIINADDMTNIIGGLEVAYTELHLRSLKALMTSDAVALKALADKYRKLAEALASATSIGISAELG